MGTAHDTPPGNRPQGEGAEGDQIHRILEDRMAGADKEAEQQQIAGHHLGEDLAQGEKAGRIHEPADSGNQIETGDMGDQRDMLPLPAQNGQEPPGQEGFAQMIRRTTDQRRSAKVKRKAAGTTITATTTNFIAAGQGASASAYCSATTIGR